MATGINPQSSVRTGATAPGLPGGNGFWGAVVPQGAASKSALWHRADSPVVLEARGLADYEVQANLMNAWDQGHDAVMLKNYIRPGGKKPETIIVVRELNQLRDPKAVFDPSKRLDPNLLASIGSTLIVPLAAVSAAQDEDR
jgi:hypothetical protein